MSQKGKILNQLSRLSRGKKFLGIDEVGLKKRHLKELPLKVIRQNLRELKRDGFVLHCQGLYFPTDWDPAYSPMELEIIEFIWPCFQGLKEINIKKIIKTFIFFSNPSLERLLLKLQVQKKIIKIAAGIYIEQQKLEDILKAIAAVDEFNLQDFQALAQLSREAGFQLLNYLDNCRITGFDGQKHRKIN